MPGTQLSTDARCGELTVAENPDQPDGRQITLRFAVKPARQTALQDPVVFLAGGPGQSARDLLPLVHGSLYTVNRERDLIFLDQRGTGGSNPLNCDMPEDDEAWLEPRPEQFTELLQQCMTSWDAELPFYTSAHAVADLESLRKAYGLQRINLVGGSYGTRLAQVYLRMHPDVIRSIVLDGIVPTRLALGAEHAISLDRTLEKLFTACTEDEDCGQAFPDLAHSFVQLKQRWREGNRRIVVTHPRSGQPQEIDFNADVLAAALRFLAYSPGSQAIIPQLVHEAVQSGDPSRLAGQALIVSDQMEDLVALGLNFAVTCSEDWPAWPEGIDEAHTVMRNSMREVSEQVCAWWPSGTAAPDFHQPFDSPVPLLLLSGEFDPVTPPEYGEEAAAQYSNSLHLVATGQGHIVMTNPCVSRIIADFIQTASVDDLDTDCMGYLRATPFFLDLLGPAP